jgi:ATP-dependent Lon protease
VLFLATANVLENIPGALRDRMEIIHLTGYTENDKLLIAKTHLMDRQIDNNGVTDAEIEFTDEGIKYLISHYTREAGVRNLERELGSLCRKVAKRKVLGIPGKVVVTAEVVSNLLGPARYLRDEKLKENQVGITTGLAWTPVGGEILYVEALKMKGKGGLVLTGQLGDVMQESAKAAMSYARAHYEELGIDQNWVENNEVHIHLPSGAIPKDGPSAGVTMATSLISLMTDTPVRKDICMTGEISLSGRVLPVGGIREKVLAALTQDIFNVILPVANRKDISEIPDEFRSKMNFMFVENLDEVFALALDNKNKKRSVVTKAGKRSRLPRADQAA